MSRSRYNALELKEKYGLIQYVPGDKTKSALHLKMVTFYEP
jgi:hypothetical protein